jgi:hypothetical protein
MRSARWLLLAGGIVGLGFWATEPGAGQEKQTEKGKGTQVKLGGLESRTPRDWYEEKPTNRMGVYQFRLSPIEDDKDNAEVVIFYFGEGQGGSVEQNIKRWKDSFVPPEGKKIDDVAKVQKMNVGNIPVTYLDIQGTYRFPSFNPNDKTTIRPNYRMLAVVFESKKGPYFIRMVGPAKTVAYYKKGFDEWIKGFK